MCAKYSRGGGHWPRKGVWGCAAVMTPFFQASRRSLAYQFTIIAPLLCPPFSNCRKIFNFQPCFGHNFSSQDANFPNFRSLDPSFFKENPLPRPYFWKPVWHIPTQKKVECPPGKVLWEHPAPCRDRWIQSKFSHHIILLRMLRIVTESLQPIYSVCKKTKLTNGVVVLRCCESPVQGSLLLWSTKQTGAGIILKKHI